MNTTDAPSPARAGPPRILLLEDDPTSSAFLSAVLRALPAVVDCADSVTTARALAAARRYDIWLLDVQLPDGSGTQLLAQLRARDADVPALAHTASTEAALHSSLIEAGFAQVLLKPLSADVLRMAVQRTLALPSAAAASEHYAVPPAESPLWDDEAAARAMNFNRMHLEGLRRLFLDELPHARRTVLTAAHAADRAAVTAALHKLQASCGFVGAVRLRTAVVDLIRAPLDPALAILFDRAALATAATAEAGQSTGSESVWAGMPDDGASGGAS